MGNTELACSDSHSKNKKGEEMEHADDPSEPTSVGTTELPPGLHVLTAEEVKAAEEAAPETATVEEQAQLIEQMKAAAEQQDKDITAALSTIGTYLLIRFENPTSVRSVMKLSATPPQDRTAIAVLERYIREWKAYEMRDYWQQAERAEKQIKEKMLESRVTQEILKRGWPNNRETRRKVERMIEAEDGQE
jgi:hypothetical protein